MSFLLVKKEIKIFSLSFSLSFLFVCSLDEISGNFTWTKEKPLEKRIKTVPTEMIMFLWGGRETNSNNNKTPSSIILIYIYNVGVCVGSLMLRVQFLKIVEITFRFNAIVLSFEISIFPLKKIKPNNERKKTPRKWKKKPANLPATSSTVSKLQNDFSRLNN